MEVVHKNDVIEGRKGGPVARDVTKQGRRIQ